MKSQQELALIIRLAKMVSWLFFVMVILFIGAYVVYKNPSVLNKKEPIAVVPGSEIQLWLAPDISTVPEDNEEGKLIRYGRELIMHTATFIGPLGSLSKNANGMNCQNCHLDAGTKPYGNNFGSVASMYPKFRVRSGGLESIERRVNDCIERSLNGSPLDSLSNEMRGIVAYLHWLGKDVPQGKKAAGSGLYELKWLNRVANLKTGKGLYLEKCQVCHSHTGEGQKLSSNSNYIYPPLSGDNSFNTGAGLFRISNFARYIYANMPQGATYENPVLSESQSWDIAAYVLSLPRVKKEFINDWPELTTKPIDHPYGPYADSFSEDQHKYGPFEPIAKFYQTTKK